MKRWCQTCGELKLCTHSKETCDDCLREASQSQTTSQQQKFQTTQAAQIDDQKVVQYLVQNCFTKIDVIKKFSEWMDAVGNTIPASPTDIKLRKFLYGLSDARLLSSDLFRRFGFTGPELKELSTLLPTYGYKKGRYQFGDKKALGYKKVNFSEMSVIGLPTHHKPVKDKQVDQDKLLMDELAKEVAILKEAYRYKSKRFL